jgi:hypothetical protein
LLVSLKPLPLHFNTNTMKTTSLKKQLEREISEITCTIQHIRNGNEVVIERVYNRWGITLKDLLDERFELVYQYNRKYGKKFGSLSLVH